MTLTEFLLARIAQDTRAAGAARGWQTGSRHEGQPLDWSIHMDRWSPDRVLAECESKRRLLDWLTPVDVGSEGWYALRILALPYADHPDFREEWRA